MENEILKPASIRRSNYRSVLTAIIDNSPCTVTSIAEKLPLSRTAIFKAVQTLTELGFILPSGKELSSSVGGKPAERYAFDPNCRYSCLISFYYDVIIVQIHNFAGDKIHQTSFARPQMDLSSDSLLSEICDWIRHSMQSAGLEISRLCGICLMSDGNALGNYYIGHEQMQLFRNSLSKDLGISEKIIHINEFKDMRGYAEFHYDSERRRRLVVVVSVLRKEITGCILNHGSILTGASGTVGDFAHVTTDYSRSIQCSCGRRGCYATKVLSDPIKKAVSLELMAGAPSSLQTLYKENRLNNVMHIVEASDAGDELARRHMDSVLENHVRLIDFIYLILNPDEVIMQVGKNSKSFHEKELNDRFFREQDPITGRKPELIISCSSVDPYDATAIGAAEYCKDQYLNLEESFCPPAGMRNRSSTSRS